MNVGPSTPITWYGSPRSSIVLPMIAGSLAEMPAPQSVADHRDVRAAGTVFLRRVRAAHRDGRAKHFEIAARRVNPLHLLGTVAAGEIDARARKIVRGDGLKHLRLLAPDDEFRNRYRITVPLREMAHERTSRSGCGYESGCSSTVLTTEKIAVFAPMPSASATIAVSANAGLRHRMRTAYCTSLIKCSMKFPLAMRRRSLDGFGSPDAMTVYTASGCKLFPAGAPTRYELSAAARCSG